MAPNTGEWNTRLDECVALKTFPQSKQRTDPRNGGNYTTQCERKEEKYGKLNTATGTIYKVDRTNE